MAGVVATVALAALAAAAVPRASAQRAHTLRVQSQLLGVARRIRVGAVIVCDTLDLSDETERALKEMVFTDALERLSRDER